MKKLIPVLLIVVLMLTGCGKVAGENASQTVQPSYTQITQDEAKEMMTKDDGHVIVDVRRQDEYDSGHIPRRDPDSEWVHRL